MLEITEERLIKLIINHLANQLTDSDEQLLEGWAEIDPLNRQLLNKVSNEEVLLIELNKWKGIDPENGYTKWLNGLIVRKRRKAIRLVISAAAVASLVIAIGSVWLIKKVPDKRQEVRRVSVTPSSVLPGRNTAVLTLSNGCQVLLDSAKSGDLMMQGKTRLVKVANGKLSYQMSGGESEVNMTFNTLSTPRSGQYQLTLPDGSRVWLNNVSSLRYPVSFLEKTRMVQLTGEGYFEIANDPARPFIVKVRDESVEVLGTTLNVMAYPEEGGTQTTLLTGSVRVETENRSVQLRPDEQAQIGVNGRLSVIKGVPSKEIVSWKNGFFYFGRASLQEVMRQLARWYDVDVVYEGNAPYIEFGGKIDRSLPLEELLKYLNKNEVHFRLEGRKIIVLS